MAVVLSPLKVSHPALLPSTGLLTPPLTPTSPTAKPVPATAPIVSYPMLRAHHATALKHVINKLRWDQTHNGYIVHEDAWINHDEMIHKLENELTDVENAQQGLDRFENCHAPTAFPKVHGPPTKEGLEKEEREEKERADLLDRKLEEQFPWLKQLFIGPKTKDQYRKNKLLREQLVEGDPDIDLPFLLEPDNLYFFENKKLRPPPGAEEKKKKPYEQVRYEKEKIKISILVQSSSPQKIESSSTSKSRPRIGPLTKEEWLSTLPKYGPKTRDEALLPAQKEQRHAILSWLGNPWPRYDEHVAPLMERMGKYAVRKLENEAREEKRQREREKEREKAKGEKEEKGKDGVKKEDK